ncbi:MAG: nuclear transport factor 2 family protein [Candidatus Xenobia bacterium]
MRVALLLLLCGLTLAPLRAAPSMVDIVVVSNEADPAMRVLGKTIWDNLRASRDVHSASVRIPIDYYDYSRPGHRIALKRLGIPMSRLPYVGLCQLDKPGGEPLKLLDGQGPVHDTVEAGMALQLCLSDLFARARQGEAADRQAIRGLYDIYSTALIHGRPHFVVQLLTPEYVYEAKDGTRIDREAMAQRIEQVAGTFQADKVEVENVQFDGDRALVRQMETAVHNGATQTTQQLDLWVRTPQGWRIARTKEQ